MRTETKAGPSAKGTGIKEAERAAEDSTDRFFLSITAASVPAVAVPNLADYIWRCPAFESSQTLLAYSADKLRRIAESVDLLAAREHEGRSSIAFLIVELDGLMSRLKYSITPGEDVQS